MSELGYTDDIPRPCNVAIQATIASIRIGEVHAAILDHERDTLASQQTDEPGQFFMRLLGLDEWFNVYLLAQRSGVQMALQQLKEYSGILACLEGDDAFELQKALSIARAIEIALTKVAFDTLAAKNLADCPPVVNPVVRPVVSPVVRPVVRPMVTHSFVSGPSPSVSVTSESLLWADTPSLSEDEVSIKSPATTPSPASTPSPAITPPSSSSACTYSKSSWGDLRCNIKENPLLDLSWLTEDELIEMDESIAVLDCTPVVVLTAAVEDTGKEEPFAPVLPSRHIEWECSKEDGCMWKIKKYQQSGPDYSRDVASMGNNQ
ncbi:unnamed protein product [Calypogeia fissa]